MKTVKSFIIAVFLFSIVVSSVFGEQWPESIYPTEPPQGKVRTINEKAYVMVEQDGDFVRELKYSLVLSYSPEGLLESEEYFNTDGSPANRIDYTYKDGLLSLKTQSHPDVINPDREIFTMSPDGRIMEAEKIFSRGNYGWKFRNSYDDKGRIILTSKYDRYWKWMLVYSRIFDYDENGRLSSTEGYGMQSELLWRDEHQYNSEGLVVESCKYNPDNELVVRILNRYNENGNYTRREFFDTNNRSYAVYTYGWKYDGQGNWTVKITGREAEGYSSEYIIPDSMVVRNIEYYG